VSIRLRLTLWLTALLFAVLTGLAVLVYVVVADQMRNRLDATLRERAAEIASDLSRNEKNEPGDGDDRRDCVPEDAEVTKLDLTAETILVESYDKCGNVEIRSDNLTGSLPVSKRVLDKVVGGQSKIFSAKLENGDDVRILGAPQSGVPRHSAALFVATPLAPLESDLVQIKVLLFVVVLGTTALCALIGWFLAAKAMKPVDEMTTAAHRIGIEGDVSGRVPVPTQHDEIGRLALTFNEMLSRLQQSFDTQRHFLADASHELRTPLTAIRANVETLRRGVDPDPNERDETLRIVEREVDRMGRLVDDLLALARADAGQAPQIARFPLDELFLEVYHQQRPLAGRVRLTLGEFEPVEVDGDQDRLKQLLLNLIDNALRYTPAGGTVTLDLLRKEQEAVIRVRDSGPGIPVEHLPHIFERFYRADPARSRASGGTGLGLAIAREIAEAHGGSIEVESSEGTGSTFTVSLPARGRGALGEPDVSGGTELDRDEILTNP
jgi:heavy metal sensor kinase